MSHDPSTADSTDPSSIVDTYLQLCEDRQLEEASTHLADDVTMVFPTATFTSLQELTATAGGRYRWVRKHRDTYDVAPRDDDSVVVMSRGRLYGENLHGQRFDDVRYIDVFVLRHGLITEQHVFNDLEASGVLDRRSGQPGD